MATAPNRPHENRIVANYLAYQSEKNPREREKLEAALYTDLVSLTKTLFIKKYGYSNRIDMEDIAHSVATSALMTIIQRDRIVHSWVQLLKKMTHDWSCKWMENNLYNKNSGITFVDLDATFSDEDGGEVSYELPHYDVSAETVSFLITHIKAVASRAMEVVDHLSATPRGCLIAKMAVQRAIHGESPMESLLPAYQQFRVRFYSIHIKRHLDQVFDSRQLENALF